MPQAALKGCATIVLKRLVTIAHRGRPAIAPRGCAAIVLVASTVLVFASTALLVASAPVVVGSTADVAASGLVAAQAFRPPVRSTAFVGRAFAPADQDGSSRPSFSEWLAGLRAEAITRGIKPDVVDAALAGVSEPVQLILERDHSQAETVFSLESYLRKRLTPKLIATRRVRTRARARRSRRREIRGAAAAHCRDLGNRVELRPLQRRAADGPRARDARVGPAPRNLLSRRTVRRARNPEPRRHRSRAHARVVGGSDGSGAVHAVELFEVRRGLRRRRPPRHLVLFRRCIRFHRELPQRTRMAGGIDVGPRGQDVARGRAADSRRRRPADGRLP